MAANGKAVRVKEREVMKFPSSVQIVDSGITI